MTEIAPRFAFDQLVLAPDAIDLSRSPLAGQLGWRRSYSGRARGR